MVKLRFIPIFFIIQTLFLALFFALFCSKALAVSSAEKVLSSKKIETKKLEILATQEASQIEKAIKEVFSEKIFVDNLEFSSDHSFEAKEFYYLAGFNSGQYVLSEQVIKAVSSLIKKSRFEKIVISINYKDKSSFGANCENNSNNNGTIKCDSNKSNYKSGDKVADINFELFGAWVFSKIKISGVLVGKSDYSRYYTMQPGDIFVRKNHTHALKKLKILLNSQGYFNSKVSSKIYYDNTTKLVSVDVNLVRKTKFSISDVEFVLKNASKKEVRDIDQIKVALDDHFGKNIMREPYSKAMLDRSINDLKKYLSRKGFLQVDIELIEKIDHEAEKLDLKFIITIHSKKEFMFFGNNFFSTQKLLEKILIYGRSAWLVPGSILSGELIKDYKDNGFWDIKIEVKEDDHGYSFYINEGSRACIRGVEFFGISALDSQTLNNNCFKKLLDSRYFDQSILDDCLDDLINFYLKSGFWDVKILKTDFVSTGKNFEPIRLGMLDLWKKTTEEKNTYKLVLSIDEGKKSYLKSIVVKESASSDKNNFVNAIKKEDLDNFFESALFSKFGIFCKRDSNCIDFEKNKIAFDVSMLSEQKAWLLKYFKDKGNLYVDVSLNVERDGQDVTVVWTVLPGEAISFGKTIVLSGKNLDTDCIMRELEYKEGQPWDNSKLKKSVTKLRTLGVFDSVHLYPHKVSEKESQKDILIKVDPSDPFEVRTRIGLERYGICKKRIFGEGFTYRFGGAFLWKNPTKNADQLILEGDIALPYRDVSLSYIVPWLFNYKIKTTFKVYANRYDQPGFMCSKKSLYQARQDGFMMGLNKVYNKLDFALNTGLEWMETDVKDATRELALKVARAINFDWKLLGKNIPYLWVEPVFLLSTVDDKLNPRSGVFTLASLKGMLPIKRDYINSFFVKFMLEQSFFKGITERLTAAFRLRIGHLFHKQFKDIAPIERFYLGGAHSIRSYEKDMCPPWGIFCDTSKSFSENARSLPEGKNLESLNNFCGIDSCLQEISLEQKNNNKKENKECLDRQILTVADIANKASCCSNGWVIAPQGGRTSVSANIEARFDIYKSLSGVVFQDMGSLFDDKFSTSNFSQATGFGFRFNTGVGPIRFDIAWKWKVRNPFESRYAWFLAFGNAF